MYKCDQEELTSLRHETIPLSFFTIYCSMVFEKVSDQDLWAVYMFNLRWACPASDRATGPQDPRAEVQEFHRAQRKNGVCF